MWVRFPPGPPDSRLGLLIGLSALLHLLLVLFLLLLPAEQDLTDNPMQGSDIAMVFASGAPRASTPTPGTGATTGAQKVTTQHAAAAPPPARPAQPKPLPAAVPMPTHAVPAPPPKAAAPKAPAAVAAQPAKPPPRPAETVHLPPLPPLVAPLQIPSLPPLAEAPPAPAHPAPPALSQGRPAPRPRSFAPPRRGFSLAGGGSIFDPFSLGSSSPDVRRGAQHESFSSDLRGADNLGPDWSAALLAWVDEHKYYPESAANKGEDGDASVDVTTDRWGHVQDVTLVSGSGSRSLDDALQSLFRDRKLPPFPLDTAQNTLTFTFTMHYIIER